MAEYVADSEAPGATATHKAAAYLVRKMLGNWNPRRLGIVPLRDTLREIRRALKSAGMKDTTAVTKAVLAKYLEDLWIELIDIYNERPSDSFMLIAHEGVIPDISYALVVLENAEYYYIYPFRSDFKASAT